MHSIDEDVRQHLGEALKRARLRDPKTTQSQAAGSIGIRQSGWSKYERGRRRVSVDRLDELAEAVGSTADEIIEIARKIAAEKAQETPAVEGHVTGKDELLEWLRRVTSDPDLEDRTRIVLSQVPGLVDEVSWVASLTEESYLSEYDRPELVPSIRDAIDSPYLEPIRGSETTVRLVFP